MQNFYLFCLCLSFSVKVKKRYVLLKKKSGIFSFRVNDILTSINCPLFIHFSLYQAVSSDLMKGTKKIKIPQREFEEVERAKICSRITSVLVGS